MACGPDITYAATCLWPGCTTTGARYCNHHRAVKAGKSNGKPTSNRLTDQQRTEIRVRMRRFESPKQIAADIGCTTDTIYRTMKEPA